MASKDTEGTTATEATPGSSVKTDPSIDSDLESEGTIGDGEWKILMHSLRDEEATAPLTENLEIALQESLAQLELAGDSEKDHKKERTQKALSLESAYGNPLPPEEAQRSMPPGEGGLIWHALLINGDPFDGNGKLKKGLNRRDFDMEKKQLRPRRASLPVLAKDFYSSLTRIEGRCGARFIFHGILNGWPSLQTFELISVERKRQLNEFVSPAALMKGHHVWAPMWTASVEGAKGIDPTIKEKGMFFRAKLRSAPWTSKGWAKDNPGFAFWYEAQRPEPSLVYGKAMVESVEENAICTNVHMVAHRYAILRESPKDKLTYHTIVLLEWDHGRYCTAIEAAYLNGMAGFRGKSNFFDDKDEEVTEMYKHFPPEMVCPWLTNATEVRAYDLKVKNLEGFKEYVKKYEGKTKRFVDPRFNFSHPCRLTFRSKKHIAQYLVNYVRRDASYNELRRNCQTLSADLCAFLAGKKEVQPFHPVSRIEYKNRSHLFLYDPDMFQEKRKEPIQANR